MANIHHFSEIHDYLRAVNLSVPARDPDFLIYNFSNDCHENFEEIPPYRNGFYEITVDFSKGCSLKIDEHDVPITSNRLTLVSPYRLQSVTGHATDIEPVKGFSLFFKPDFLGLDIGNHHLLNDFPFFNPTNYPALSFGEREGTEIMDLMHRIHQEYINRDLHSKEIIKNYIHILLLKAANFYSHKPTSINGVGREQEIFRAFEQLVSKHFLEMTTVNSYADKLHVSSKHLSVTIKKVSGKSALQFIHQAQLTYAKALLKHTGKTVSEVAYELNFENPDYFSVFFKKKTGQTPIQFRIS